MTCLSIFCRVSRNLLALPIVLVCVCSLPGLAQENPASPRESGKATLLPSLAFEKSIEEGLPITVRFNDPSPGPRPWITIVEAGADDSIFGQYFYTEGKSSGEFVFNTLSPGHYEVRFHSSEESVVPISVSKLTILSSDADTLSGDEDPVIQEEIPQPTLFVPDHFEPGSRVRVQFVDPAPGPKPWITIVEENADGAAYEQFFYTERANSGEFFFRPLSVGTYEVRFHTHETSRMAASVRKIAVAASSRNASEQRAATPAPSRKPMDEQGLNAPSKAILEFLGTYKQGLSSTAETDVRIWDDGHSFYIEYPGLNCRGRLSVQREEPAFVEFRVVNLNVEGCGYLNERIVLQQTRDDIWHISLPRTSGRGQVRLKIYGNSKGRKLVPQPEVVATRIVVSDNLTGVTIGLDQLKDGRSAEFERVTNVASGSPAEAAGLRAGDLILDLSGAESLLSTIRDASDRNELSEVQVRRVDGAEVTLVVPPYPVSIETPTARDAKLVQSAFSGPPPGRFSRERPALPQLLQLADALGVSEREISHAISVGRLNPHPDDLFRVYFELADTTCRDMYREVTARLRSEGEIRAAQYAVDAGCEQASLNYDLRRIDAWNKRFGPRPEQLETRRNDPTVLAYFRASRVTQMKYAQLRCDFSDALSRQYPAVVDCSGVHTSDERNLVFSQMAAARNSSVFETIDHPISFRLQLIADGAFEALDKLTELDQSSLDPWKQHALDSGFPDGERARYTPLIAMYITARMHKLGACGDPTTRVTRKGGALTVKRISGAVVSDNRYEFDFSVSSRFAPILRSFPDSPVGGEPFLLGWTWSRVERLFEPALSELTCDSEDRRRLEMNMISYAYGDPPAFRR